MKIVLGHILAKNASIHVDSIPCCASRPALCRPSSENAWRTFEIIGRQYSKRSTRCVAHVELKRTCRHHDVDVSFTSSEEMGLKEAYRAGMGCTYTTCFLSA